MAYLQLLAKNTRLEKKLKCNEIITKTNCDECHSKKPGTIYNMETCILDLSQITYSWDSSRKILTMYSPTKEILTEVVMDQKREVTDREAAFTACEKALDRSKLKRHAKDGKIYKVNLALYNPISKEISVGSSRSNKIYSGVPLNIPVQGLLAKEVDEEFILEDGQHLYKVIPDFNHVTRILHSHREN